MIKSKQNLSKKSLFKEFNSNKNSNILQNTKSSSYNNLKIINDLGNPPPKNNQRNVISFIKEKNKFFLENSFDVKGTREFLASKEVAMRAIKLNDEIIEEKKRTAFTNKNLLGLNFLDECPRPTKRKSAKVSGKRTISPRKSRKSHKKIGDNEIINTKLLSDKKLIKIKEKKMKKNSKKKIKKLNANEKNIILNTNIDSNNSNIYKFIIDNANEHEEIFNLKLKEELKKVENIKQKKNQKRKSVSKKDLRYKHKPKRLNSVTDINRDKQSIFMFSEINKKLMEGDDISISSIGEQNINLSPPLKKVIKRSRDSLHINSNQVKERLKESLINRLNKKKKNHLDKKEDNSEKDSIISILSDLM